MKNTFCSYCGELHQDKLYPRRCLYCFEVTYLNPAPVAVTLVPVGEGLLVVRRNIEPKKGHLCLPGGFMNEGESWQEACVRELYEETSLTFRPASITLFTVLSSSNNQHLLVFGLAPRLEAVNFESLHHDHEVSEVTVVHKDFESLAFPSHEEVARRFFGGHIAWTLSLG